MINPEFINKTDNIYNNNEMTILDINSMPYFDKVEYDLLDEKSFKHYFADLERTVRNSFEYRKFIRYLKNTEGMSVCSFLDNVSCVDNNKVKIEIHHYPLTLYDICMAVFKKRQANKEDVNVEAVAEEVMYLHYIGWVGLIPLSATVHDMFHNNYIFIPLDRVRGFYKNFVDMYYNFIDPDVLDALDAAETETAEYNGKQMEMFNNHSIYINVDGSYMLPEKDNMKNELKNKINELKSNKVQMVETIR